MAIEPTPPYALQLALRGPVWVALPQAAEKKYLSQARTMTPAGAKKKKRIEPLTEPDYTGEEAVDVTLPRAVLNTLRGRGLPKPTVDLVMN